MCDPGPEHLARSFVWWCVHLYFGLEKALTVSFKDGLFPAKDLDPKILLIGKWQGVSFTGSGPLWVQLFLLIGMTFSSLALCQKGFALSDTLSQNDGTCLSPFPYLGTGLVSLCKELASCVVFILNILSWILKSFQTLVKFALVHCSLWFP